MRATDQLDVVKKIQQKVGLLVAFKQSGLGSHHSARFEFAVDRSRERVDFVSSLYSYD